jgi:hypothetical protein
MTQQPVFASSSRLGSQITDSLAANFVAQPKLSEWQVSNSQQTLGQLSG